MLKNYIKKLIMRWLLTWLNGSVATLNATLQLLVIYWWIEEFFVLSNQFHIKFQIDSNSHEKKHLEHLLPVSTIASWHLYHICTELIKASQNDDLLHALERNIYCISVIYTYIIKHVHCCRISILFWKA